MRPSRLYAATALWAALVHGASAQGPPTELTVQKETAKVHSGPGEKFYATNELKKGDVVQVVRSAENGWLAIVPPPGSSSWVSLKDQQLQQVTVGSAFYVVDRRDSGRVEVYPTPLDPKEKPNVIAARLARGTQVAGLQSIVHVTDGPMLNILPPAGEVRYIRQSDVAAAAPPVAAKADMGAPLPPVPGAPGLPPVTPTAPPATTAPAADPEFVEAQRLEREGKIDQAVQLYDLLAKRYLNTDNPRALQYMARADTLLRARGGTPSGPRTAPGPGTASLVSSGVGVLVRTDLSGGRRPPYWLRTSGGLFATWAIPEPGVSLEKYVDQEVELLGYRASQDTMRVIRVVERKLKPMPR